jgi:hypothetical protein
VKRVAQALRAHGGEILHLEVSRLFEIMIISYEIRALLGTKGEWRKKKE